MLITKEVSNYCQSDLVKATELLLLTWKQCLIYQIHPLNWLALEAHIRGLEALGKSHESYGDILAPIIHKKLPFELKKSLARDHSNKEWTLDELRKAILKEVEVLEAGQSNSDPSGLPSSDPAIPTASFLTSFNRNTTPKPNGKRPPTHQGCAFCKGRHNSLECTVEKDPSRRHAIIQEARLCFNCLGCHRVAERRSKNRCRSNISKTRASVSSGVPNTEKVMKARGRRPSTFIVSRCLEPLMKH